MSDTSALAAARVEAVDEEVVGTAHATEPGSETNLTQRHGGTEERTDGGGEGQDRRDAYPTNAKEREEAVARIRKSNLPPVMRERLAAVMEASESSYLDVAVCLEAIEETLPEFLRGGRGNFAPSLHPLGNGFFQGSEEMTDAEAETLATKQLERSGLLRGQRVRVGD